MCRRKSTYAKHANIYGTALKHGIGNLESGNGITEMETETETGYGICERWFQAINLKKINYILEMIIKIHE